MSSLEPDHERSSHAIKNTLNNFDATRVIDHNMSDCLHLKQMTPSSNFKPYLPLQKLQTIQNLDNFTPSDEDRYEDDEEEVDDRVPFLPIQDVHAMRSIDNDSMEATNPVRLHLVDSASALPCAPSRLPQDGGSILNSFFNMANSIIGAGIIGLPFAFSCTGYLLGILLLLSLTVVVDWTIRLIVINAKITGKDSYQDIVEACYGTGGLVAVSLAQILFAFGGMTGFCIILGDTFPDVLESCFPQLAMNPYLSLLIDRKFLIIFFTCSISYPLSLYKDITKLAKASAVALASMCLILTTVVYQGPMTKDKFQGHQQPQLAIMNLDSIEAISVISFAFVCHHNSLLIYGSLRVPTINRFALVTHISTGVSCLACMIMALAGYLVFSEVTQANILNNFPADDGNVMVILARFCFGFNCLTTLPIEAFVCREVVAKCFYSPRSPHREFTTAHHVLVTSTFVFGAMSISLVVKDLGVVLDLTGGTSACALAYILPPMCYLKCLKTDVRTDKRKWAAVTCIIFGFAVMLASITKVAFR